MRSGDRQKPDWKDAAAYAPLLQAGRSIIAWEWLRRDPAYRAAACTALGAAAEPEPPERWGLHRFEHPDCTAPHARPVWSAEIHSGVLLAEAVARARGPDAFDLRRFAGQTTVVPGSGGREHLLVSDGLRSIRLDSSGPSLSDGPVHLTYRLGGIRSAERPLRTLRRFLMLCRERRFSRSLHPPEAQARRWVLMLRAADALAASAGQREIAAVLLSPSAAAPRWRTEAPSLRSQAQRLLFASRRMAAGEWRALLKS